MNTAMKVFLMIFVVAVFAACSEAQFYGYGRFGGRNQANQGGDIDQGNDQDAYNVNFGRGDLNNNQRNQASQQGYQRNQNGRGGYGYPYYGY